MNDLLMIRCQCQAPYHVVSFDRDPDFPGAIDVSMVSTSAPFWWRVRAAWKHILGSELVVADVTISAEDAQSLAAMIRDGAAA